MTSSRRHKTKSLAKARTFALPKNSVELESLSNGSWTQLNQSRVTVVTAVLIGIMLRTQ